MLSRATLPVRCVARRVVLRCRGGAGPRRLVRVPQLRLREQLAQLRRRAPPRAAVVAVGEFLGPQLGASVGDDAALDRIVAHSSFDAMRKDPLRWASKRPDDMPEFVRKGVIGDWANHFSSAQVRRMLARLADSPHAARLRALWPEIIQGAESFAAAGSDPRHSTQ